MRKRVVVNDKMQKSYRYELTAPAGRDFDPEFKPDLTPPEMLALGVFCGKYMTDTRKEFPKSWFTRAKLAGKTATARSIISASSASQPLSVWRKKGWIHPDDPRGWFQWYCRYYWAGAWTGRTSGRSSAGRRSAGMCAKSRRTASRAISPAAGGSARRCCIGPMTAARSERA